MKIKNILSVAAIATALLPLAPVYASPLPGICDALGNASISGDTAIGGSGNITQSGAVRTASFAPAIQSKVNAVSANLTASSLSGSQSVGGNTVNVDPAVAQVAVDVIGSSAGSDNPAVKTFTAALGGGDAAQQLAKSMQGLKRGDGSIDAVVLTSAVSSYNNYLKYSIDSSQITKKPASELNSFVEGLPAGQKAAQVVLSKLTEAAR
ncbi:hypothetical protein [Chamaesiphon sp. VAR_48_metabat_135_sub]|uniref:hypothetical protein n=1 Tax=Chamaesiphon sp. VAR_48_metabat_135_sub TaxID=2964699 RepID=UPI00286A9326|nr:hypothetical protein [Chamaesiphon sp. VAR_48_metabat_135_sub]